MIPGIEDGEQLLGGGLMRCLPRGAHVEDQPLDLDFGGRLADDRLRPADGIFGCRRREHPVGLTQDPQSPGGEQLRVAGADADAGQAPGSGRIRVRHGDHPTTRCEGRP